VRGQAVSAIGLVLASSPLQQARGYWRVMSGISSYDDGLPD
jgi:hypothetical protein